MRIDVEILFGPSKMVQSSKEISAALIKSATGSPRDVAKRNSGNQKSAPQTIAKAAILVSSCGAEDCCRRVENLTDLFLIHGSDCKLVLAVHPEVE